MATVRDDRRKLDATGESSIGEASPSIEEILRGTAHAITIFTAEEKADLESEIFLKKMKPYLKCYATGKDRPAKPEEIVRQFYLKKLIDHYGYPTERIAVEKPVQFGVSINDKAADIVVWDKDDKTAAQIIIECKKPKRKDGLEQLKSYLNAEGAPISVWIDRIPSSVPLTIRAFVWVVAYLKGQGPGPSELRCWPQTPPGLDTPAIRVACCGCSAFGNLPAVSAPPSD